MKVSGTAVIPCSLLLVIAAGGFAQESKIERGKYLTVEVGKCQDCHTPRTPEGALDETRWLKGAALDIQPTQPVKGWHKTAPDLTSGGRLFERWKAEGLVKFLETGLGPGGHAPDPPMPAYKLKHEDAEAIVEYLKSLK